MAKTLNAQQNATAQDEAKKQRKKQAKREAKLMLELGEAKTDLQRAEQKFSKAQGNLEAARSRLHEIEEQLVQIRDKDTEKPEPPVVTVPTEQSDEHPEETRTSDQGE
jgi:outer membrane protein TolC